jgi:hypothetical protein
MNSTDLEQSKIYDWAKQFHSSLPMPQKDEVTYFTPVDNREPDIIPYEPENFPDIRQTLQNMWQGDEAMEEIVRVCAVAMLKCKPSENRVSAEATATAEDDDLKIPPFIYVF